MTPVASSTSMISQVERVARRSPGPIALAAASLAHRNRAIHSVRLAAGTSRSRSALFPGRECRRFEVLPAARRSTRRRFPLARVGSATAIATATPSAVRDRDGGGRDRRVPRARRARAGRARRRRWPGRRIDRRAACLVPEPPRGLLGGDPAPELVGALALAADGGQRLGSLAGRAGSAPARRARPAGPCRRAARARPPWPRRRAHCPEPRAAAPRRARKSRGWRKTSR